MGKIPSDNACPINSDVYDNNIRTTLPFYDEFRSQIMDVIDFRNKPFKEWLDLGCGTGSLAQMVLEKYPETHFTLADPAASMLEIARKRLGDAHEYICAGSQDIEPEPDKYDVVTAIQSHHYLQPDERAKAVKCVYDSLKDDGIFICFENVLQADEGISDFEYRRWLEYRFRKGVDRGQLPELLERLGTKFFPITIPEHLELLKKTGFSKICLFWMSYMQMGVYGIK